MSVWYLGERRKKSRIHHKLVNNNIEKNETYIMAETDVTFTSVML